MVLVDPQAGTYQSAEDDTRPLPAHDFDAPPQDAALTQPEPVLVEPVSTPPTDVAPPGEVAPSGKTLLRGGSWNTVAQFAPLIVNLVLTPYVIHGLGKEAFGLYILATSIADFLGTFDGGLYSSSQRYFSVYAGAEDRRATSRLCLSLTVAVTALGSLMVAILTFAAPLLISVFHIPLPLRSEGTFMLRTLGVVIALELLRGVFAAILNARQRFALSSLTTIGQYAIYATGVILTISNGWGLRGIALTMLTYTGLSTFVLAIGAKRYLAFSELRLMPRRELREFLGYAGKAQVAGLSDLINLQSDAMIIGGFINVSGVALYSSGRNFAAQMRSVPWNAIAPAASMLGQTYGQQGPVAVRAQFRHLQRLWVQVCSGWVAVAAAAAYFGVTRWLGTGFRLAGVVAVVLLIGYLFRLWAGMLTVYCQTIGHPELEARYGVVSVVVNLILTLALVYPFGVLGVVAATALGQLVGSIYLLRIVHLRLGADVPSFLPEVPWVPASLAAGVTVALELACWPLLNQGPLGLVEAGVVAAPGLILFGVIILGPIEAWRLASARIAPVKARTPYGYEAKHGPTVRYGGRHAIGSHRAVREHRVRQDHA